MKSAQTRPNNKKNQKPHTNTLETKTIRVKSWRDTLLHKKRTPAIAAIAAGFFIASASTAAHLQSEASLPTPEDAKTVETLTLPDHTPTESVISTSPDTSPPPSSGADETTQTNNVRIETKIESRSSSQGSSETERSVTINDIPVPVPDKGTYRQTFKDDTSKTTVRVRGNGSGISLHTDIESSQGD